MLWSKNYEKRVTLVMIYLISSKRSFWGNVAIYVVEALLKVYWIMVILTTCIYLRNFSFEHSNNIPEGYRGSMLLLKPDQCMPGYTRLEIDRKYSWQSSWNLFKSRWETIFGLDKVFKNHSRPKWNWKAWNAWTCLCSF